jgi:hypothetical protein
MGVDSALDTGLAVGLAGVALTGAIFLIGFASPIVAKINQRFRENEQTIVERHYNPTTAAAMRSDTERELADDRALVKKLRLGAGLLVGSFFAFVFLLLENVLIDHMISPITVGNDLSGPSAQDWLWITDLLLSGLPALVGLILLGYGALVMKNALLKELVPADIPPQAPATTDTNSNHPTGNAQASPPEPPPPTSVS